MMSGPGKKADAAPLQACRPLLTDAVEKGVEKPAEQ
jgi:hypothetical protein